MYNFRKLSKTRSLRRNSFSKNCVPKKVRIGVFSRRYGKLSGQQGPRSLFWSVVVGGGGQDSTDFYLSGILSIRNFFIIHRKSGRGAWPPGPSCSAVLGQHNLANTNFEVEIFIFENFPKMSLLEKLKIFHFKIFSDWKFVSANHILQNFLSAKNFPEWSGQYWFGIRQAFGHNRGAWNWPS
jgi:hypothetical protein